MAAIISHYNTNSQGSNSHYQTIALQYEPNKLASMQKAKKTDVKSDVKSEIADQQRAAINFWLKKKDLSVLGWCTQAGISEGTLRNFLSGQNGAMGSDTVELLARAIHISVGELLGGPKNIKIPILYKIGAGAQVYPIDDHAPGASLDEIDLPDNVPYSPTLCGFRIEGDSQAPMLFDGYIVLAKERVYGGKCEELTSKTPHIVQIRDGACMLKLIRRGYSKDKYNLRSYNPDAKDIDDIEIEWYAKIEAIIPK